MSGKFYHPTWREILTEADRRKNRFFGPNLPKIPLPLLITGVTGVAGYNALAHFQSRYPGWVYGLLAPDSTDFGAEGLLRADPQNRAELAGLFEKYHFGSVLDCAGNCALKACQLDPEIAWTINVEIIRNLAALTERYSARLVHFSVDMVYGGRPGGNYREEEPITPVNVYGETMGRGEDAVAEADRYAVTLRISMPMGLSVNDHAGAIDWIAARFKANRPATLYFDEVRTPTYTDDLSRVAEAFLGNDHAGILHAGGPRPVSLYQMAQIINRLGGFSPDLLYGLFKDEACPVPPRVANCSLNSEKIGRLLGWKPFTPWPFGEDFVPDGVDWHRNREKEERGSVERMIRVLAFNPALERES